MLSVQNLNIFTENKKQLLHKVSFNLGRGKFKAIVGESGSGKSITALSIARLLSPNLSVSGSILWDNTNILTLKEKELIDYRKTELAFVFQNPMHCLNPVIRCGEQIAEVFKLQHIKKDQIDSCINDVLRKVNLLEFKRVKQAYPHELSGGQKQRIMIAIALASKAKLLIADEPSTALDVLVQKDILDLLKTLQNNDHLSILFITHDLNLAFKYANDIIVMKDGKIIEENTSESIRTNPQEKYTQGLVHCRPQHGNYIRPLPTVDEFIEGKEIIKQTKKSVFSHHTTLFEIKNLSFSYGITPVLHQLNFSIIKGESLGIVGASGSGKSTFGKCLMRIEDQFKGSITLSDQSITEIPIKIYRQQIQMVFQDPYGSLDGRPKVKKQLDEIYTTYYPNMAKKERLLHMVELLEKVGLNSSFLNLRPRDLSGGQRQRICIARCLISGAKTLILDESIAALDVSIQAKILNLLNDLRDTLGLTYIFISHDLESVNYFCDRILVLNQGHIEEIDYSDTIMTKSQSKYTQQLLKASISSQ